MDTQNNTPGVVVAPGVVSPYLTAKEAADYLRVSYDHFRHIARHIKRCRGNKRYLVSELDYYAMNKPSSLRR